MQVVGAGEVGELAELLDDIALDAPAAGLDDVPALPVQLDVRALAGVQGLDGVLGHAHRVVSGAGLIGVHVSGDEVGVVRVEVPQRRAERLGGQEHRPGGLEPVVRLERADRGAELLEHHLLPRVELEDGLQVPVLPIGEAGGLPVQPELLHLHESAGQARLDGGVHEIARGHEVLAGVIGVGVGEVVHVGAQAVEAPEVVVDAAPLGDELLVDAVPLVDAGHARLQMDVLVPVPLDEGGLHQPRGGVRVVLQHPGRPPVVARGDEIEARVERGVVAVEGDRGVLDGLSRDAQVEGRARLERLLGEEAGGVLGHHVEVLAGALQEVDLVHGQLVAGELVPVARADPRGGVGGLGEDEALVGDGVAPPGAR